MTTTDEIIIITAEEKQKRVELQSKMLEATSEEEMASLQKELLALNIRFKKANEQRQFALNKIYSNIKDLGISFADMVAGAYSEDEVRNYASNRGWVRTMNEEDIKRVAIEKGWFDPSAKPKKQKEVKGKLVVGTFYTKDFPKFKDNKEVDPEFVWEFYKRYGPTDNSKFINAIKEKGWQWVIDRSTEEFQKWLQKFMVATKGKGAGNKMHRNFREFMFKFGIEPAEAEKIISSGKVKFKYLLDESEAQQQEEQSVEEVRVQDEHSQVHPEETNTSKSKNK